MKPPFSCRRVLLFDHRRSSFDSCRHFERGRTFLVYYGPIAPFFRSIDLTADLKQQQITPRFPPRAVTRLETDPVVSRLDVAADQTDAWLP